MKVEIPGLCDILIGIFRKFKNDEFVNDRRAIHLAFKKLRDKYDILKNIVFKNDIIFPESQMLDEALYSLQPDFLGKINPSFDRFKIKKEKIDLFWDKKLKDRLGQFEQDFENIARELEETL